MLRYSASANVVNNE